MNSCPDLVAACTRAAGTNAPAPSANASAAASVIRGRELTRADAVFIVISSAIVSKQISRTLHACPCQILNVGEILSAAHSTVNRCRCQQLLPTIDDTSHCIPNC